MDVDSWDVQLIVPWTGVTVMLNVVSHYSHAFSYLNFFFLSSQLTMTHSREMIWISVWQLWECHQWEIWKRPLNDCHTCSESLVTLFICCIPVTAVSPKTGASPFIVTTNPMPSPHPPSITFMNKLRNLSLIQVSEREVKRGNAAAQRHQYLKRLKVHEWVGEEDARRAPPSRSRTLHTGNSQCLTRNP